MNKSIILLSISLLLSGCSNEKPVTRVWYEVPKDKQGEVAKETSHCASHIMKRSPTEEYDNVLDYCLVKMQAAYTNMVVGFQWVDGLGREKGPKTPCKDAIKAKEVELCGIGYVMPLED
jgi:hypothetical protein